MNFINSKAMNYNVNFNRIRKKGMEGAKKEPNKCWKITVT